MEPDGTYADVEPIVGNKRIEDAAIGFVIEQERRFGREAEDTRYRGAAADLESAEGSATRLWMRIF